MTISPFRALLFTFALLCPFAAAAQGVSPTPRPHQNFVDNSGNPCAGCSLFSYLAGTTTDQPTYTDYTGGSQNTNPIILDAAGGANIWLTPAVNYKFVLEENGATQWTVDQVPGLAGQSLFCLLAGCTFTGPVSGPAFNGTQYVGHGSNSTIQAAITAAGTTGSVIIPAGYTGTDTWTNTNGVYVLDLRPVPFTGPNTLDDINVPGNMFMGTASGSQIGANSQFPNGLAIYETCFGAFTCNALTTGEKNTAFGWNALNADVSGRGNTALGMNALPDDVSSDYNTAVGADALWHTTATQNDALGVHAGWGNTTGTSNDFIGVNAGFTSQTGNQNVCVGGGTCGGQQNETGPWFTGSSNTVMGFVAGDSFVGAANANTLIGHGAGVDLTTSSDNTAVGFGALGAELTAGPNTAFGYGAMSSSTAGSQNDAFGVSSLNVSSGNQNSAFGDGSLQTLGAGGQSSCLGYTCLFNQTTGSHDTAIGFQSGLIVTTGSNDTYLGDSANGAGAADTYETVLGSGAIGSGNNSVTLGRGADALFIPGTTGLLLGMNPANNKLQSAITTGATASTPSGTAVTLFAAGTTFCTYEVFAHISGNGDVVDWSASAILQTGSSNAKITSTNAANFTLTLSSSNIQATQTSGAAAVIDWSFTPLTCSN